MTASLNSKYDLSWMKDNISGLLLLVVILIAIFSIVIYSLPQSITELVAKLETVGTNYSSDDDNKNQAEIDKNNQLLLKRGSSETIEESWSEDAIIIIGDSTLSVGESDNKDNSRVVISEKQIIGSAINDTNAQQLEYIVAEEGDSLAAELSAQLDSPKNSSAQQSVDEEPLLRFLLTPKEQLLAISPYLYTVRLSEANSVENLLQFMELHTLPNEGVYVYQTQRNNQPWYVIIFGQFDSFQLAKEAGVELASSSSELSAWVEMYETIHQDLRLINE